MIDLTNHFLVASPTLENGFFSKSVIYICEYSITNGALGLILTNPTDLSVSELIMKIANVELKPYQYFKNDVVLSGGPVNLEHGFVLHTESIIKFEGSIKVTDDIFLTTSVDYIDVIGTKFEPKKMLMALGCCTWYPNQLEQEIKENSWYILDGNQDFIFNIDYDEKWDKAYKLLGIDKNYLIDRVSWN